MEVAQRLNPLAQQCCEAFSKHSPWRCRCTESKRLSTKSTDWCTADHLLGRALRKEKRGPRMLARTWTRRASCGPGGGRLSSNPERPCPRGQPLSIVLCGGFWPKLLSVCHCLCMCAHRRCKILAAGMLLCLLAAYSPTPAFYWLGGRKSKF